MGYTTYFFGQFQLNKQLTPELSTYLKNFANMRHYTRNFETLKKIENALIYPPHLDENTTPPELIAVDSSVDNEIEKTLHPFSHSDKPKENYCIKYNQPQEGCPGLWLQWIPNETDDAIEWDGGEKFYHYVEWLEFLIKNIFEPNGYVLNGTVSYEGEDSDDFGNIICENNKVFVTHGLTPNVQNLIDQIEPKSTPKITIIDKETNAPVFKGLLKDNEITDENGNTIPGEYRYAAIKTINANEIVITI